MLCAMSTEPLRLGIIGLKGINDSFYAPAAARNGSVVIAAGVDPSDEARQSFAAKHPTVPLYASLAEALKAQRLEAVVIGTPNHIHLQNIREAAAARLHMLVTKPMCNTVAECREAIQLARDAGVVLQAGHEFRFRPGTSRAIELVRQGVAGDVTLVTAHMGHMGGLTPQMSGPGLWRNNPANCPGGCANLLGVHYFDIATAIMGVPTHIQGVLRHFRAITPIEDTAVVTMLHRSGVSVVTSSYASLGRDEVVVHGTEANLVASAGSLVKRDKTARHEISDLSRRESADVLIAQLVGAVRHGQPVQTPGEVGLLNVAILEAALLSERERRTVAMSELLTESEISDLTSGQA